MHSEEWKEGYNAFLDRLFYGTFKENRYDSNSKEHEDWLEGWYQAGEDS